MKKAIKTLSFIIVIVMLLPLIGCAGNNTTSTTTSPSAIGTTKSSPSVVATTTTTSSKNSNMSAPGVFPIVKDKVTLTFFAPQSANIEDIATNDYTKWYEEKTNVHIVWETTPATALNEKRTLVLASGDYPDVFFSAGVTKNEEMIYGTQGVFIPLNDLIETYGVETKKVFEKVSYIKQAITTPGGNIYGLPSVNEAYHMTLNQKMWINQKWLDKLNLKMPTTTDEFYQVLKAFKEKDPNGNGQADEIPLVGAAVGGLNTQIDGFLMCAFIYNDDVNRLMMKDGKVDMPVNKPEFKEGLTYLNKLYAEGLIYPASLTQDKNQLKQLMVNPSGEIVGAVAAFSYTTVLPLDSQQAKDYEPVPPLKGPKGVQTTYYNPYGYSSGAFVITNACKTPEIALRWADYLSTDEAAFATTIGREGKEWKRADPGKIGINGKPAVWEKLPLSLANNVDNIYWHQMGPSCRTNDWRLSEVRSEDPYSPQGSETRLYNATKLYEPYKPAEAYPPVYMKAEQANEISQLQTTINNYVDESVARYITGDLNINKDWDTYVKNLNNMGIKRYLEIYQEVYDAQYK